MSLDQLYIQYRSLQTKLLSNWQAPVTNDFFAMVFFGVLKKLAANEDNPDSHYVYNLLLQNHGGIISAAPPKLIAQIAALIASDKTLCQAMVARNQPLSMELLKDHAEANNLYSNYLNMFGDRSIGELKLETKSVKDDPSVLLHTIGNLALSYDPTKLPLPAEESKTKDFAKGKSITKQLLIKIIASQTKQSLAQRENLRFALSLIHISTFILFYQLRVADEFKDHIDDCRYAPERPVPRGLVSLRELGSSAVLLALLQLAMTTALKPGLWPFLFAIWIYFALMSKEFFVASWLRQHPVYYMLSHMFILVFSDLFITAVDFVGSSKGPVLLLLFFLTGSFFNGMVIEFGRKIKAPECEREGMESYSRALGLKPAVVALTASVIAAQACLTLALPHLSNLAALVFAAFDCFAFVIFQQFMTMPNMANQKKLEALSGLLVALSYLTISLISWI